MEKVSRRGFLKGAGMTMAAGAVAASAGTALADEPVEEAGDETTTIEWASEADIVIIGSGSGGGPASVRAADLGNSVILIEKADWLGGSMRRCGGGIAAPNTCVQKALGVEDDLEDFYNYIVDCGEGLVNEELLRTFADRATEDFDWYVLDIAGQTEENWYFVKGVGEDPENGGPGIDSHPDGENGLNVAMRPGLNLGGTPVYFEKYGFEPVPRCFWFEPNPDDVNDGTRMYANSFILGRSLIDTGNGGTGLWKPCEEAINARDIEIHMSTLFESFVVNTDSEVIGVRCVDLTTGEYVYYKANKAVHLATGDWENNAHMLDNYALYFFGDTAEEDAEKNWGQKDDSDLQLMTSWAPRYEACGEGILAAMALGADTMYMPGGPWRGGIRTDAHARVLNTIGQPIPRLYASSYAVGGKWGLYYPHCGLHNMWNISMGLESVENITELEPITNYQVSQTVANAQMSDIAAAEVYRIMNNTEDNTVEPFEIGTLNDGTYTGVGYGVGGPINVEIDVNGGMITVANIYPNYETSGQGGYEGILNGVFAEQIDEAQSYDIDGISGSTLTSNAIRKGAAEAIKQAME